MSDGFELTDQASIDWFLQVLVDEGLVEADRAEQADLDVVFGKKVNLFTPESLVAALTRNHRCY